MSWRALAGLPGAVFLASGALWSAPVVAQNAAELIASGHVMIRSRLEPAEPVYVGQPVRLWVEVMTETWFLEAPRYPATVEVAKAIVVPPESFGVNSSERIDGDTYAVQGRAFTIFPQTTGSFEVPPIEVRLVVARDDASRSPEIALRTEPATIEAALPEGAEGHGLVLSTPQLTVDERYNRSTERLRVGESFERQVTMSIEDSVAMLLPPIEFEVAEGIAVYPGRPELSDTRDRGEMSGRRVDQATYVMEAEGSYVLPAISVAWWNLSTSRLEEEVLPEVELSVGPNPDLAAEHFGEAEPEESGVVGVEVTEEEQALDGRLIVAAALSLVILVVVLRRLGRWLGAKKGAASREAVEAELFREFEEKARAGDAKAAYAAFVSWLDHLSPVGAPVSPRELVKRAADDNLSQQYDALMQELYSDRSVEATSRWSGEQFCRAVRHGRRVFLRGEARQGGVDEPLPPLNPAAR